MNKVLVFILLSLIMLGSSADLFAIVDSGRVTGAPLDGGLLALLAAVGLSYYANRRRKNRV